MIQVKSTKNGNRRVFMKRVQLLLLTASLSLLLFACSNDQSGESSGQEEKIETIITHGNFIEYDKENQLFDDAELVVIAKTDKNFIDREHVVKYVLSVGSEADLPPAIEDFYTRTPITITKVLKQPESSSIAKSDNITIIEPVSLLEDDNGLKKLSIEHYLEIEEGKNYILYLKKNTYGEYSVINMNNGRFNLEAVDKIKSLSEHGPGNNQEKHEKMKKAVEKRFEKEIKEINITSKN
jgi:hypothetical protein